MSTTHRLFNMRVLETGATRVHPDEGLTHPNSEFRIRHKLKTSPQFKLPERILVLETFHHSAVTRHHEVFLSSHCHPQRHPWSHCQQGGGE